MSKTVAANDITTGNDIRDIAFVVSLDVHLL